MKEQNQILVLEFLILSKLFVRFYSGGSELFWGPSVKGLGTLALNFNVLQKYQLEFF